MVRYNIEEAKKTAIEFCRVPVPKLPIEIAAHLKKNVANFYKKSTPERVVFLVRKTVLEPLVDKGFLVRYTPNDKNMWYKARGLVSKFTKNRVRPRKITELYGISFLYLADASPELPLPYNLPIVDKELNLDLVVFFYRFEKPSSYLWDLLNFLFCCSNKEHREELRLFLYSLNLGEKELDIFERLFDYGESYKSFRFPLSPNLENSKNFIRKLTYLT